MRGTALLVLGVVQGLGWSGAVPTLAPSVQAVKESRLGPFGELVATSWESERRAAQVVDAHGCDGIMGSIGADLNDACCVDPESRCSGGAPHSCSRVCATLWMPYQKECSLWLLDQFPSW